MSRAAQKLIAASGSKDAYEIEQSLMFAEADDPELSKTPSSTGSQRIFTFSFWFKRAACVTGTSPYPTVWSVDDANSDGQHCMFMFYTDAIYIQIGGPSQAVQYKQTNRKFRDLAAWYHCVWQIDTTDSTAADRSKLWINGSRITSWATEQNVSENADLEIGTAVEHVIGKDVISTSHPYDGYLAEWHFIDGTVVAPSAFAETDSDTGQWIPKKVEGLTYGTNGYYLKFESGAIGTDSSGQSNNYTTSNLANSDVMPDSPTNNFPTLNALANTMGTLGEGNLKIVSANDSDACYSTVGVTSGKWYWEVGVTDIISGGGHFIGVGSAPDIIAGAAWYSAGILAVLTSNGNKYSNGLSSNASYIGAGYADGDIVGVALDMDAGKMYVSKNGVYAGDAANDPADGEGNMVDGTYALPSGHVMPIIGRGGSYNETYIFNFGQNGTFNGTETAQGNADGNGIGDFYYSPPSGFLALCASNYATPTIKKPTSSVNVVLYAGNDSTNNITGFGFQPDLVWIKNREESASWAVHDVLRGITKALACDTTAGETSESSNFTAISSDGFNLAGSDNRYNDGDDYWSWGLKANGSGSANTAGDIDSTVSVNTDAGFSIVSYTGDRTGSGVSTVGHGLSSAPKVVITKRKDGVSYWYVQHPGTTTASDLFMLDSTAAETDKSGNGTLARPTSTVFSVNWSDGLGTNSQACIAYCFADVEGFSKFGSYTGNGAADGPFVYTGFRPAWVMTKLIDAGMYWTIIDSVRNPYNDGAPLRIYPQSATYESSYVQTKTDLLSNGFKVRGTYDDFNKASTIICYFAFAEFPFKYANAR